IFEPAMEIRGFGSGWQAMRLPYNFGEGRGDAATERRGYRAQRRRIQRFHFPSFPPSSAAMADSVSLDSPKPEGFLVHLAGHVLLFDKRPAPDFNASAGMRLLAIAIVVEALRLVAVKELTRRFATANPVRWRIGRRKTR